MVLENVPNPEASANSNYLQAALVWGVPVCSSYSSCSSVMSPRSSCYTPTSMYTRMHLCLFILDVCICFGMLGIVSMLQGDPRQELALTTLSLGIDGSVILEGAGHLNVVYVIYACTVVNMLGNTVCLWRLHTHREYDTRDTQVHFSYMLVTIIRTVTVAVIGALCEVHYLLILVMLQFCLGYACVMIDKHKEYSMMGTRCQFDDYVHVHLVVMYLVGEIGVWVHFVLMYTELKLTDVTMHMPLLASQCVASLLHCMHMLVIHQAAVVDWELSNVIAIAINTYTTASLTLTTVVYVLRRNDVI